MPTAQQDTIRITRLQPVASGGFLLGFNGEREAFLDMVDVLRSLPRPQREFHKAERAWWISGTALVMLMREIPALREYVNSGGGQQQKTSSDGRAHGGNGSPRPPAKVPAQVAEALRTLCITPDAPVELVSVVRRFWARQHHPDRAGGNLATMKAFNHAADVAEEWLG